MSLRSLALVITLVALAIFAAVNWSAFTAPATLSLVVATVQAPLGLIMLMITGLLAAHFLTYIAYLQSTVIFEARRSARELAAQRERADQAELSRFTELRNFLDRRLQEISADAAGRRAATQTELERLETVFARRSSNPATRSPRTSAKSRIGSSGEWMARRNAKQAAATQVGKPWLPAAMRYHMPQ